MAASMLISRTLCRHHKSLIYSSKRCTSNAYYVLLPEIPPDTAETNPIMRYDKHTNYSALDAEATVTGCAKLSIEYGVELGKHLEKLAEAGTEKSFNDVFDPIEKISVPLNFAWRNAKNLNYVKTNKGYRKAFQRVHPQVERAKNERWINEDLYHSVKEVSAEGQNLTEYQRSLVDMYILEARLNGIELSGSEKTKFLEILQRLVESKNHFRNRVMLSHNLFAHTLEDFSQVVDLPQSLVKQMAVDKNNPSRGPWKVTLNQNIYQPFMEHCTDRNLRWNVWQAHNNRCSVRQDEMNLSNHIVIKDIQMHRSDIAKILGYENYAQMSMETKMAGSVENVMNMIESFKAKFKPLAENEIAELQKFANADGFRHDLEMFDLPYWRRRHRESLFKLDPQDLAEYFPLPKVLDGLFNVCNNLFGISIKDCTGDIDAWHEDVQFYRIYDKKDGEEIASFYLDPYARPEEKLAGSWMEAGREHSFLLGTKPISFLNMNLTPPFGDQPSLLTVEEAATIFYEFGHGLQQMLTRMPYSEVAGQRNIEWDALQVCSMLMSMIFLHRPVLKDISSHVDTGESLPDSMIDTMFSARKHMYAYDHMRQLYFSALDMEMYVSKDHWYQIMTRVWSEMMPIPMDSEDNHVCSLTAIFSDQYPAAYYSFKWAEMIAADVFSSFQEAGFENPEKVAQVGSRFRDTFLALGGGVPANEVFRRFQGRDPTQEALIKYHDNL